MLWTPPFPRTFEQYHLLLLTLAWFTGFGWGMRRAWSWPRSLGLALVSYPFWKLAVGVWLTIGAVFAGGVAPALTLEQIWDAIFRNTFYYAVVPGLGLLLVYERFPTFARGPPREGLARDNGLLPVETASGDALSGAALFFGVAFAYVFSLALVTSALGDLVNTGDDSAVFDNVTPATVLLLSVVAGVTEEFLFRGVLLSALDRGFRRVGLAWVAFGLAVFVQAAFFGLVHSGYGNLAHIIGPFLFGLGMGFVVRRLGLLAAIVLHAEVDVLAIGLSAVSVPVIVLFGLLVTANVYALLVLRDRPLRRLLSVA